MLQQLLLRIYPEPETKIRDIVNSTSQTPYWLLNAIQISKTKNHFQTNFVADSRKEKDKGLLTACSEAPMYLFNSSGPFTDINRNEQAAAAAPTM